MTYLKGFLPWIVFSVLSVVGWQWGALAALLLSAGLLWRERRAGAGFDGQILDIGALVYFAALTVFAFVEMHSGAERYDGALSSVWLALVAWASLAVRRPFTTGIARGRAPREVWDSPVFLRMNMVLTLVWSASFTAVAVAAYACDALSAPTVVRIAYQAIGLGIPAYFTHRYVALLAARRSGTVDEPAEEVAAL
ncbi:hypothetical protein [Tsukamurella soli]|uniref:Intracellular septation protein A n=1 Tax=Tsukamurella soli TaxID=644556 RepID=A0ABP8K8Z7_9ACTN